MPRLNTGFGLLLILAGMAMTNTVIYAAEVISFTLINADTNNPIAAHDPLRDAAELNLVDLPTGNLNIRANVDATVGSVSFNLSGAQTQSQTESEAPYALFGDNSGNYNAWTPAAGGYQLSARSHTAAGGGGTAGNDFSIAFSVINDDGTLPADGDGGVSIGGELMRWHKVTIAQSAVAASETSVPNPFLDYRFNVLFSGPSGQQYTVPGYFAGDGNGGRIGTIWQAHFAPDQTGQWEYQIDFRQGGQVAVDLAVNAGSPVAAFDGASGSFMIAASNKAGADFRAPNKGMISNQGGHYLQHASGQIWVKGGPNIPENMFGYTGFDNTPDAGHSFSAHISDWDPGDPDWNGGDGRGLIGALNYIGERGANSIYFLPMNIGGDGEDTFPTIGEFEKTRYDLSKLTQWEIALNHAQSLGIFIHFVLAETEAANENYHDNGNLGEQRMLFYRMLLALFGHHNGLQLNIGEENDYGSVRHQQFAAYLKAVDPYDHPLTTHTRGNQYNIYYDPLLGNGDFDITSFQGNNSRTSMFDLIADWRTDSANAGVPWVISFDEPQRIDNDVKDNNQGYPHGRRDKMWPLYMAGGGGFEWYVQQDGGGHGFDQSIDDFGMLDAALTWTGHALSFLNLLPLEQMTSNRTQASSASGGNSYVMSASGQVYAVYNDRNGGPISIDLSDASSASRFVVQWFNPRTGVMQNGSVLSVTGGGLAAIGSAPDQTNQDWAVLLVGDEDFIFDDGFEAQASNPP